MIDRFSRSERVFHWLLAVTFFIMLGTGLALYLPGLAQYVARPTAKAWHLNAALALAGGTVLLFALRWSRLSRTIREFDRFDRDDREWMVGAPTRILKRDPPPPQGRFNAGQKLNAALVGGLMLVTFGTGTLLWYGERDTRFRFAGTVVVHDWATWILVVLVAGHLYLALIHPSTRHALRGMMLGSVRRSWAVRHHPKWVADQEREGSPGERDGSAPAPAGVAEDANG